MIRLPIVAEVAAFAAALVFTALTVAASAPGVPLA